MINVEGFSIVFKFGSLQVKASFSTFLGCDKLFHFWGECLDIQQYVTPLLVEIIKHKQLTTPLKNLETTCIVLYAGVSKGYF